MYHISFRNESRFMLENEFAEQCFLRRKYELKFEKRNFKALAKTAALKSPQYQSKNYKAITEHT